MIRTVEHLIDRIAAELTWRRRELTDLRVLVQQSDGSMRSKVVVRASVALLYAHWEGFVKKVAGFYLEYVSSHRLPYRRLKPNFVALSLRTKFEALGANGKVSAANELAEFFCTKLEAQSNIPYKNIVDTKSNLSSKVLLDILSALGLSAASFETRLHFIDANLVNPRNHIAHGETEFLTVDEYLQLHEDVISLIEQFRNEVENSSVQRSFERPIV